MQLKCPYSFAKKLQSQTEIREKVQKHLCTKKLLVKCWWNWRVGSILPLCLHAAFTCADPKSVKIQSSCQNLFALLGSVRKKALIKFWRNWHLDCCSLTAYTKETKKARKSRCGKGWDLRQCERIFFPDFPFSRRTKRFFFHIQIWTRK